MPIVLIFAKLAFFFRLCPWVTRRCEGETEAIEKDESGSRGNERGGIDAVAIVRREGGGTRRL